MKFSITVETRHRVKSEAMSFKELMMTLCCPNYGSHNRNAEMLDTATAFIHQGDSSFHRDMIGKLTARCSEKPFICSDFEAGPGSMITDGTQFPSFYAGSITGDSSLTYEMGRIAALEGRELGYNWTLGPTVDICSNPDTPTTGLRGAGMTPEEAAEQGLAYMKGCQNNGMIATAKHFPGDGFGIYDQHLTTPQIPLTVEEWRKTSGKVYKKMIEGGVMAIMPGHISFPAYDDRNPLNGEYPPATLSSRLMKDLLKGDLGFEGIIISDAVKMGGFSGFMNFYEACARFFECGGDLLLFAYPDDVFIREMKRMVDNGILTMTTLYQRAARIIAFKEQVNRTFESLDGFYDRQTHEAVALKFIESSIEIVRDRRGILPIAEAGSKKALHLILAIPDFTGINILEEFTAELDRRFESVDQWIDPGNRAIIEAVEKGAYDLIICSIANDYNFGTNVIRMNGFQARNLMGGWVHMGTPVLFVIHYHPFTAGEYRALMDTVVNTNGTVENTLPVLADMICGSRSIRKRQAPLPGHDWTLRRWLDENCR